MLVSGKVANKKPLYLDGKPVATKRRWYAIVVDSGHAVQRRCWYIMSMEISMIPNCAISAPYA
jgi:hypothetical protein